MPAIGSPVSIPIKPTHPLAAEDEVPPSATPVRHVAMRWTISSPALAGIIGGRPRSDD
jgi:hypothetical protein